MESLRVISLEPPASTSISAQVNTMVALSLKNPCCQKIDLIGTKVHGWPPVPNDLAFAARG